MTAKEYLSQALWLNQRINTKLEQLANLKALAMRVNSNHIREKVSGGRDLRGPFENTMAKIVDLENEINQEIDQLIELKQEIMDTISQVDDPIGQIILEMRYVNGKGWDEIARDIKFDIRTAFRIHGKALKQIEEIRKVSVNVSVCQ
jgi:DNA-directed RNA polymerase specialized sigma subunit